MNPSVPYPPRWLVPSLLVIVCALSSVALAQQRVARVATSSGIASSSARTFDGWSDAGACEITATAPPPEHLVPGSPAWIAWWDGCIPNGAVGPGKDRCDSGEAWQRALTLCCIREVQELVARDRELSASTCGSNFVSYAWLRADCSVADAECNHVVDSEPTGFPGHGGSRGSEPWMTHEDAIDPGRTTTRDTIAQLGAAFVFHSLFHGPGVADPQASGPAWSEAQWDTFYAELSEEERREFDMYMELTEGLSEQDLEKNLALCQNSVDEGWELFCMSNFKESDERASDSSGGPAGRGEDEGQFMDPHGNDDPCGLWLEC